ncbi:MAG: hypothetical protein J2P25_19045 [Nocardiopsaceae bacterium]|nr:hypothetical protein [Nocardiopsaceae bacterium]
MLTEELVARFHVPEPTVGTIRTSDGRQADVFNIHHYPVQAVCRVCGKPIRTGHFLRPFTHSEGEPPRL